MHLLRIDLTTLNNEALDDVSAQLSAPSSVNLNQVNLNQIVPST
jgi:hypothetical protein